MTEIKETLEKIEVKILFRHTWFPPGKFISFLDFYTRVKKESEKSSEATNIKKFFARQSAPLIPLNEANKKNIEELQE